MKLSALKRRISTSVKAWPERIIEESERRRNDLLEENPAVEKAYSCVGLKASREEKKAEREKAKGYTTSYTPQPIQKLKKAI